ncbi:MAG: hypothetical protein JWM82_4058 [Myxococcales bacterium]|nr:hypothetical protein [Myxococcales bacterium]
MNGRSLTFFAALCGLSAAAASGCKQDPLCPALGSCGGAVPVGRWILAPGYPSCAEDLYIPASDTRLVRASLPPTQMSAPEPALFDWCVLLVASAAKPAGGAPRFYYESGPFGAVSVKYEADGHFSTGISRTGVFTLDYPAVCVREFGLMDLPADPTDPKVGGTVCNQLQGPLADSAIGEGSYRNLTCAANPDDPGGCLCTFEVDEAGGPGGTYQVLQDQPNTLLHLNFAGFPEKATYCRQGNHLQLTGTDGDYLFAQKGLRTLDLTLACPVMAAPGVGDMSAGSCDTDGMTCVYGPDGPAGCTCTKQGDGSLAWVCL